MTFHQGTNGRVAVLLPGRSYSPHHPLFYYAWNVLLTKGWSVEEVWWKPDDLLSEEALIGRVKTTLDKFSSQVPLVVGKSLGSLALPLVIERGLPAIWLTPLLNRPELVEALSRVTSKTLLVGGTADDSWNGDIAKASGQQVLELLDADHGLEIPGDPLASVGLLKEIVVAITLFVENL
ncbi:MAG: hypothetical protein WA090_05435 [Candidatus Nanopelagicaceae bacterium]